MVLFCRIRSYSCGPPCALGCTGTGMVLSLPTLIESSMYLNSLTIATSPLRTSRLIFVHLLKAAKVSSGNGALYLAPYDLNRVVLRGAWRQIPQDHGATKCADVLSNLLGLVGAGIVQYDEYSAVVLPQLLKQVSRSQSSPCHKSRCSVSVPSRLPRHTCNVSETAVISQGAACLSRGHMAFVVFVLKLVSTVSCPPTGLSPRTEDGESANTAASRQYTE